MTTTAKHPAGAVSTEALVQIKSMLDSRPALAALASHLPSGLQIPILDPLDDLGTPKSLMRTEEWIDALDAAARYAALTNAADDRPAGAEAMARMSGHPAWREVTPEQYSDAVRELYGPEMEGMGQGLLFHLIRAAFNPTLPAENRKELTLMLHRHTKNGGDVAAVLIASAAVAVCAGYAASGITPSLAWVPMWADLITADLETGGHTSVSLGMLDAVQTSAAQVKATLPTIKARR